MADKIDQAGASMIKNLEEKTGKSLEQWVALTQAMGGLKHGELLKRLKEEHGLTHGYANLVAHRASGVLAEGSPQGNELVAAMFGAGKEGLRPIYDRLTQAIGKFGTDVEMAPKKAYVSVRRGKQFAILQPSTKTRFDVGINLKGVEPTGRLEASGSFNSMVSHRVRIEQESAVDEELIGWLKAAYDQAK